jgi:hypothetical protein
MRVSRLNLVLAVTTSVLLVGVGFSTSSGATTRRRPKVVVSTRDRQARFVTRCTFSHRLSDDPIVKPNQPGSSHSHDFFGNVTTNAASTVDTLQAGGTTCINASDHSGYWVPSLSVDGTRIDPAFANVYYQSAGKPHRKIKTIPLGLEVVAGDSTATAPQDVKVVSWNCGANEEVQLSTDPPTCPGPTLTVHINFPDCWNGASLDSADHKSHLAYHGRRGTCPAGYPVPIPRLRLNVHYPSTGGPGVTLASGGKYSAHADFFNAWVPAGLDHLVKSCINAGVICNARRR